MLKIPCDVLNYSRNWPLIYSHIDKQAPSVNATRVTDMRGRYGRHDSSWGGLEAIEVVWPARVRVRGDLLHDANVIAI